MPAPKPLSYKLSLEPDLAAFSFEGRTEIALRAEAPCREIVLNACDLAIWRCDILLGDQPSPCPFAVDPRKEELCVHLPSAMQGDIRLVVTYRGNINDRMAGFYRSAYRHAGETRYIAVTQFQESDARRAFPCMDHPAHKATFDIDMVIDPGLVAVSNTAEAESRILEDGRKRVVFERTPRMSTYLVFFGVGAFDIQQDAEDPRVRAVTLPGMQAYARYGLEFARRALAYCEAYYGIDYPLPKLDLIAVPDFAYGAMENWGAITFRENLLLRYPQITSAAGEERICEVIAHELAHQWFGNLVTPADWTYLWLNESFATYFGFGVVAHHQPLWETWQQFMHAMTASALARDGLQETFAIEIPGGEHVIINTATAPIIYNKGGSILRQVEDYIGPRNFRDGLRRYLETHAYGCASSHHLWEALEAVAELPVTAMMKSWIEQPGFPLVTVSRDGDRLVLTQQRFTYLAGDADQSWLIPVSIALFGPDGAADRRQLLLDAPSKELPIDAAVHAYKLNSGQSGFYRVKYEDPDNLGRLSGMVADGRLPAEDRWGLQNDLFALVRGGQLPLQAYLAFLTCCRAESAYLPLTSIAANLAEAFKAGNAAQRRLIASKAADWFGEILSGIAFEPQAGEKHTTALLRDQLLWEAVRYGSRPSIDFAAARFDTLLSGGTVHADIMRSVMSAGAWMGDDRTYRWFIDRLPAAEAEHERQIILTAIGCFRHEPSLKNALDSVIEAVPARNKAIPIGAMAENPAAVPLLWDWFTRNLAAIEAFHPMMYERIVAAIVPAAGMEKPDEVRSFFEDYARRTDKARDAIRLSLEKLAINLQLRDKT